MNQSAGAFAYIGTATKKTRLDIKANSHFCHNIFNSYESGSSAARTFYNSSLTRKKQALLLACKKGSEYSRVAQQKC